MAEMEVVGGGGESAMADFGGEGRDLFETRRRCGWIGTDTENLWQQLNSDRFIYY